MQSDAKELVGITKALTRPICHECNVRAEMFITSPAALYGISPEDRPAYRLCTVRSWTGEWFCPECRHFVMPLQARQAMMDMLALRIG